MEWRNAGPKSHPATAARSGGKSNKIRAMRIRRRRMGPTSRYDNVRVAVRAIDVGCEESSFVVCRGGLLRISILVGCLVNVYLAWEIPHPRVFCKCCI